MTNWETVFENINDNHNEFYVKNVLIEKFETFDHQHNKAQFLYAEGGILHIFTDEKHWYLPARCFMIIPAHTPHSLLSFSSNVQLYNFYFSIKDQDDNFFRKKNIYFANDLLREMIIYTKSWDGAIEKDSNFYHFLQAIKSILPDLNQKEIPFPIQHPFPKDEKLIEIAKFLAKNLDKNYTLEEIALEFGMSSRTLSRKFKIHIGISYVHFLRSLRITRSLELISEKKYNMYEIAILVGYNSLSTFSNIFQKVLSMRPTDYQQMIDNRKDF